MSRIVAMTDTTADVVKRLARASKASRGSSSGHVYAQLRNAIVTTQLPPGAALSEAEVAQRLNVSRTPVREAFRRLAAEGFLTVSPQVGSFVARLDRQQLLDALFIRESLECGAARLAARAPKKEREQLAGIVARQRHAIRARDVEGNLQHDHDLHRSIMELAGHAAVWEVVLDAREHMERLRRIAIPQLKGNEEAVEHHDRIAKAIIRGNPDDAARVMREHVHSIEGFIDRIREAHPEYF